MMVFQIPSRFSSTNVLTTTSINLTISNTDCSKMISLDVDYEECISTQKINVRRLINQDNIT